MPIAQAVSRLACSLLVEAGIEVCAPVHDALLIVGLESEKDAVIKRAKQIMSEASAIVLDGFRLRADEKIISYPDRYMDERGRQMWDTIWQIISELEMGSAPNDMGQLSLF